MAPSFLQRLALRSGTLALLLQAACVCGPGPNVGGYDEPGAKDPPKSLQGIKFIESEKGDPASIGCADGQREGFADVTRHRRVAGCLASWEGTKSLRDKPGSKPDAKPCGDDGGVCAVPADACAPGWHVCGTGGKNDDLKTHTTFKACNKEAGPGKFVAALSHGQSEELCPPAPTPDTVFPCMDSGYCAEPVCCGDGCQFGKCRDGVWKGQTRISLGKAEGCGSVTSERNGGVMCCYDKNEDPPPLKGAEPPATPPAADSAPAGVGTPTADPDPTKAGTAAPVVDSTQQPGKSSTATAPGPASSASATPTGETKAPAKKTTAPKTTEPKGDPQPG